MRKLTGAAKGVKSLTASFGKKSASASTDLDVDRENRTAMSSVDPIQMQVGELSMQFKDNTWTSAGSLPSAASGADAAENDRLKKENEQLRGEVSPCTRQRPPSTPARPPAAPGRQVNLLKFKMEILVDMLTLANLNCEKLEDAVDAARGPPLPARGKTVA